MGCVLFKCILAVGSRATYFQIHFAVRVEGIVHSLKSCIYVRHRVQDTNEDAGLVHFEVRLC